MRSEPSFICFVYTGRPQISCPCSQPWAKISYFGAAPGRNYGTEIDGAISWRSRLRGDVGYELGAQAGRLFPGNAFQMADGSRLGPVNAVRFRATLVF